MLSMNKMWLRYTWDSWHLYILRDLKMCEDHFKIISQFVICSHTTVQCFVTPVHSWNFISKYNWAGWCSRSIIDLCLGYAWFIFLSEHGHSQQRISSVPPGKRWDSTLIRPLLLPSHLQFIIHHPAIQCYMV
jgi:hypothetical protein